MCPRPESPSATVGALARSGECHPPRGRGVGVGGGGTRLYSTRLPGSCRAWGRCPTGKLSFSEGKRLLGDKEVGGGWGLKVPLTPLRGRCSAAVGQLRGSCKVAARRPHGPVEMGLEVGKAGSEWPLPLWGCCSNSGLCY